MREQIWTEQIRSILSKPTSRSHCDVFNTEHSPVSVSMVISVKAFDPYTLDHNIDIYASSIIIEKCLNTEVIILTYPY